MFQYLDRSCRKSSTMVIIMINQVDNHEWSNHSWTRLSLPHCPETGRSELFLHLPPERMYQACYECQKYSWTFHKKVTYVTVVMLFKEEYFSPYILHSTDRKQKEWLPYCWLKGFTFSIIDCKTYHFLNVGDYSCDVIHWSWSDLCYSVLNSKNCS